MGTFRVLKKMLRLQSTRPMIFTLPCHTLPSQYRSLLPVSDPKVDRIMKVERANRHIRNAVLTLAAALVLILVSIIGLMVAFQVSMNAEQELLLYADVKQKVVGEAEGSNQSKADTSSRSLQATSCQGHCWQFSAFKFRATCENKMCRCQDELYDDITCLPRYDDCHINVYTSSNIVKASLAGNPQIIYMCTAKEVRSTTLLDSSQDTPNHDMEASKANVDISETSSYISKPELTPTYTNTGSFESISSTTAYIDDLREYVTGVTRTITPMADATMIPKASAKHESIHSNTTVNLNIESKRLESFSSSQRSKSSQGLSHSFQNLTEIHVISIFGNRRAPATRVHLSSGRNISVTLVLVSYEPVLWNLTEEENLLLQKVFLISNYRVESTSVYISRNGYEESTPKVSQSKFPSNHGQNNAHSHYNSFITRILHTTGYGNDQMSGSTPQLLQYISEKIGRIKSFVGIAYADFIHYNVDLD